MSSRRAGIMRILCEQDVDRLIEPTAAVEAAAEGYRMHAERLMAEPGRLDLRRAQPKSGALILGGFSDGRDLVVKTNVHAYSGGDNGLRRAGSMLVIWDMHDCIPRALVSAAAFNNHRTAAGFAAAARRFAPANAKTLAVFGSGKIAPATIRYLLAVRPIDRVEIVSRRRGSAAALAATVRAWPQLAGVEVMASDEPEKTARSADIIATVTTSEAPVFPGHAVRSGCLVILGGANRPDAREADDALFRRAVVIVDHLEGCLERAGDLRLSLLSGALERHQILGEIGALVPIGEGNVVVFKSIGIAPQDLVLAQWLIARAESRGAGIEIDVANGSIRPPIDVQSITNRPAAVRVADGGTA
jgi:alanine dehydrogenase